MYPRIVERRHKLSSESYKGTDPTHRVRAQCYLLLLIDYFLWNLLPHTVTLEVRISVSKQGRHGNIQTIAWDCSLTSEINLHFLDFFISEIMQCVFFCVVMFHSTQSFCLCLSVYLSTYLFISICLSIITVVIEPRPFTSTYNPILFQMLGPTLNQRKVQLLPTKSMIFEEVIMQINQFHLRFQISVNPTCLRTGLKDQVPTGHFKATKQPVIKNR